jgi:hypothetical protein
MFYNGPISVKSCKQKIVTKSSTEAELVACSDGTSTTVQNRNWMNSQGYQLGAVTIRQDNTSTISWIEKGCPVSDSSKHIHTRYFHTKERVEAGEVDIEYVPTEDMIADILTKPLQGDQFRKLRDLLTNFKH